MLPQDFRKLWFTNVNDSKLMLQAGKLLHEGQEGSYLEVLEAHLRRCHHMSPNVASRLSASLLGRGQGHPAVRAPIACRCFCSSPVTEMKKRSAESETQSSHAARICVGACSAADSQALLVAWEDWAPVSTRASRIALCTSFGERGGEAVCCQSSRDSKHAKHRKNLQGLSLQKAEDRAMLWHHL